VSERLLLHLDGLPGVGKTTLARAWVGRHHSALCLDIDLLRRSIGGWREDLEMSGRQARRLAYRIAAAHLSDGYDVVVPQYAVSREFVAALQRVAAASGATYRLVLLTTDDGRARLDARTAAALEPQHVEAGEVIATTGFPSSAPLAALVDDVAGAVVLDTAGRTVEQSCDDLEALLAAAPRA
jgi:predicted kinase